jgi:hypothetical protein
VGSVGWAGGARRDTRVRARVGAPGSVGPLDLGDGSLIHHE